MWKLMFGTGIEYNWMKIARICVLPGLERKELWEKNMRVFIVELQLIKAKACEHGISIS